MTDLPNTINRRRACLLAAAAAWTGLAHGHETSAPHRASAAESMRLAIVQQGERALADGDAETAIELFERAGRMAHEADAELGLVRAMMQAGAYRRALAFAAHVAGVHPEESGGSALYAWLLHIGAQDRVAGETVSAALARMPADQALRAVRDLMAAPTDPLPPVLLAPPVRLAPMSPRPAGSAANPRATASGIVIGAGQVVLTARSALAENGSAWVRDGLGRSRRARPDPDAPPSDLVRLLLEAPLEPAGGPTALAPRDAFAGAPAFTVGYPGRGSAAPAWPLLRIGFLGSLRSVPGTLTPGTAVPDSFNGAAVFDARGALAGLVMSDPATGTRLVPASMLRGHVETAAGMSRSSPMLPDEIYERALSRVVQVLVAA